MKLRTIHVESFGLLRDKTLQLDGPLTVLYGRNEAGKSTLMAFIRAILFGFPTRGAGSLEPLMGMAHGGYLTLETTEGERIRVERREGAPASTGRARAPGGGHVRVTLASGAQGGAELLQPLLGGITGELFRSLFAFSLSELQEVRTLQSDALSGYLYSAGLGARGDTIMTAERKLATEMEQLFRPRGRNQTINQTLLKLEEQEFHIRRSKDHAGRYNEYMAGLAKLDEQILAADISVREQRSEVAWLEAAEQARSHWLRSNELRTALEALPRLEPFPEDALLRFNDLNKDKDQLGQELDRHQLNIQKLQSQLEQLSIDPSVLVHHADLEALYEELTAYQVNQTAVHELRAEVEQQHQQLERQLRQIGKEWTEQKLKDYAITVVDREQARQWEEKLKKQEQEVNQSLFDYERIMLLAEEAKAKASGLESKLLGKQRHLYADFTFEAQLELDALISIVPLLRKQLQMKQQLQLELRHLIQREQDYGRQAPMGQAPLASNNGDHTTIFRYLTVIANVLIPFSLLLFNQTWMALISFVMLLAVTIGVWVNPSKPAHVQRGRRHFPAVDQMNSMQSERAQLELRLAELEKSLNQRLHQLAGLIQAAPASSAETAASRAVTQAAASAFSDQQAEEILELLQKAAEEWREGKREIAHAEQIWQEAVDVYEKQQKIKKLAEAKLGELEQKRSVVSKAWITWLAEKQLMPELSPAGVLEIFQIMEYAQQQLQQKQRNEMKCEALQQRRAEFEQQVQALLPIAAGEEMAAALRQWKEAAERAMQSLQIQQRLNEQLIQARSDLIIAEDALERITQRILELWTEAGATDEQQFRLHTRQHDEFKVYSEELQQLEVTLQFAVGLKQRDQLEMLLQELTPQELKIRISEGNYALQQTELAADQWKENRGKLRNELEKLEQGAEHSDRLQQFQEQAAILSEQAAQWAKTALCSALFRKARELYERERQPGVLLLATGYFREITAGEYVRVLVPIGEKRIMVEHASGRILDSSQLSRGTAEQLYLSMRFALAEEYARKASLPLILDDILVNFDKERMEQTIAVLQRISSKHQVLLFTCHRHVAAAFAEQIPMHQQIVLA